MKSSEKKYSALVVSSIAIVGGSVGLLLTSPVVTQLGWQSDISVLKSISLRGWLLVFYLGVVTVGIGYY